ncbi:RICIN domain-containing protein [Actinomadura sp. ATCC 31491]|uniref:RICIN domain-containing protein n=1 Tax=Actinomadura luzonensis TaxID=2805427 RepID=A0ABT0FTP2_9ACTN|nr:RICIN domain-containing protein [Actinomadura luzonensis]MCK2215370.1 RICIN domain-containing protein [Actinomadura luzonensis]
MTIRRRLLTMLATCGLMALVPLAAAQPSFAGTPLGPYVIQNVDSKLCVQPDPADTGPDIQVRQDSCANPAVRWWFWRLGGEGVNTTYHIQNTVTGNCLRALSNTDFAQVQTIDCTGISDLVWSLQQAPSGGHLEVISHVSNGSRCLDVLQNALVPTTMDVFHCSSTSTTTNGAQVFFVQPVPAS